MTGSPNTSPPSRVTSPALSPTRIDSEPPPWQRVQLDRSLNGDRAPHGICRAGEHRHDSVTEVLHLVARCPPIASRKTASCL